MALGATDRRIMRLIMSRGFKVALIGGGVGIAAALSAGPIVSPLLYNTSAHEPLVYVVVLAILGAITISATALPAIRATRVQPSSALRVD
jgi:ABC-type antimicrobial peptide transport system permease subunit